MKIFWALFEKGLEEVGCDSQRASVGMNSQVYIPSSISRVVGNAGSYKLLGATECMLKLDSELSATKSASPIMIF